MQKIIFALRYERYSRRHLRGQALVEIAILLPILLIMILASFDFGRALYTKIVTTNAAREGANYISRNDADKTNCAGTLPDVCYLTTIDVIQEEASSFGMDVAVDEILVGGCCTNGLPVVVTITKPLNLFFDNILIRFRVLDGPVTITSQVRMMVQ